MRSEGARAPVWGSLAATMDDEARTIVLESGSQVGEILACLELIAAVAEETLPDVTTAARARVAAAQI